MKPKYPNITVNLSDRDGNAFAILRRVRKAMRRAGISEEEITEFSHEAMSGDYDHLLQTVMRTVETE
mgnify:CR=1 FL=1